MDSKFTLIYLTLSISQCLIPNLILPKTTKLSVSSTSTSLWAIYLIQDADLKTNVNLLGAAPNLAFGQMIYTKLMLNWVLNYLNIELQFEIRIMLPNVVFSISFHFTFFTHFSLNFISNEFNKIKKELLYYSLLPCLLP